MSIVYTYNPIHYSFEELKKTTVGRDEILGLLINSIKTQIKKRVHQHWLIVGPRGIGKSHIIAYLYQEVKNDLKLSKRWFPILFSEQGYGILSLRDFMTQIVELAGKESGDNYWEEALEVITTLSEDREAVQRIHDVIIDYNCSNGKKLLLLVENLDRVFGKRVLKNTYDEKWLRAFLMNENAVLLVGTSPTVFKKITLPNAPFYNLFRIEYLEQIRPNEVMQIWEKRAILEGRLDFLKRVNNNRGAIRAILEITGGNPRLILMLYQIAIDFEDLNEVEKLFFSLLEELTPYFQSRTENISPQKEKILITFATNETLLTPAQVAKKINLSTNLVTAQLKELEREGFIRLVFKEQKRRGSYYDLAEHLYRYWYLSSTERGKAPVRILVRFISIWYSEPELMRYQEMYSSKVESRPEHKRLFEYSQEALSLRILLKKKELRKEIVVAYDQGEFDRVIELSPLYLKEMPKDVYIIHIYGVALTKKGNLSSAIDNFKIITEIEPDDAIAFINWGIVLTNLAKLKGDETLFRESFDKYRKAIKIKPNNAIAFINWGIALSKLADLKGDETIFRESFDKYRKAIKIKPDDTIAFINWGIAFANLAELKRDETLFRKSFDKYRKVIELKQDDVDAFNNWGIALTKLAELNNDETLLRESFNKYRKSVELKTNYPAAFYNWGIALFLLAELKRDKTHLQESLDKFTTTWEIIREKKALDYPLMVNTPLIAALIALSLNKTLTYKKFIYELLENLSKVTVLEKTSVYFYSFLVNLLNLKKIKEADEFITEILKTSYEEKLAFLNQFRYIIKYYTGDKTIIEHVPKELQKVLKEMIKEIEESDNTWSKLTVGKMTKRDTYIYELKDGHKIVYYGITKNPDERFISQVNSDKIFTHMRRIRGPISQKRAEELETEYIQRYQRQHGGRPPRYNILKTY